MTLLSFRWPPLQSHGGREVRAAREKARREAAQATHELLEGASRRHPVFLLGDANGCPGGDERPGVTGRHGQGPCTPGGEELVHFADSHTLRLMGTYFPKPAGRGTTWRSPLNHSSYTLDHVLTRSRDACRVTDVDPKSLPECSSDHRCVVVTINPRRGHGGHLVLPFVAECADAGLTDSQARPVTEDHTAQAITSASGGAVQEGSVGAGTGMKSYSFKAGIGTASRVSRDGYTVGALVLANGGGRHELRVDGVPVGRHITDLAPHRPPPRCRPGRAGR